MRSWAKNRSRQLCWGLVLLAFLQPVLALDCQCACDVRLGCFPETCEQDSLHCHAPDQLTCHKHDHDDERVQLAVASSAVDTTILHGFALRRCQCPIDCDCQGRHSSDPVIVRDSKDAERSTHTAMSSTGCSVSFVTHRQPASTKLLPDQTISCASSALSLCAALCRFVT